MLRARGLSIGYPGRTVAAGIDLAVQRGEVLCLLGPNGAGKTTLFKTLLGLIPPLGGEVTIDDRPIDSLRAPSSRSRWPMSRRRRSWSSPIPSSTWC